MKPRQPVFSRCQIRRTNRKMREGKKASALCRFGRALFCCVFPKERRNYHGNSLPRMESSEVTQYLDFIMCLLWIVTYLTVLVSTLRYKYPTISPFTQLIIAPFEFAVLSRFLLRGGGHTLWYVTIAYVIWSVVEILIIIAVLRIGRYSRRFIAVYIAAILVITALMVYLVAYQNQMFFFSYFNTFIGEILWFLYVLRRKDYPIETLTFLLFFTKFVGDAIAIPVYFRTGTWISSLICVMLPMLDGAFIFVHIYRDEQEQRRKRKRMK